MAFGFAQGDAPIRFGGGPPIGNETWVFAGDTWVRDPGAAPPARCDPNLTLDIGRGRAVLFGGFDTGFTALGDTWEYVMPALATTTNFGTGCAGSAGVPHLAAATGSRAVLGASFALELSSVPASGAGLIALGVSDTAWSGSPLPASLAPVGMPGCTLLVSLDTLYLVGASPAGIATLTLTVPSDPAFAGVRTFVQGAALDPGVNALGVVVSNGIAVTAGVL